MSLLVLHCFAQLAAEQIRCGVALICSPGAALANGWAGKNFIWGSSWRKQQGKGQSLRIPLRLLPGARGTRGTSSLLFWGCFSLRICGIFAVPLHPHQCLLPWCLDMAPRATKTNPISRHFPAFPGISSHFQAFPVGLGRGKRNRSFSRLCPASLGLTPQGGAKSGVTP